jgi:hypothetical protein
MKDPRKKIEKAAERLIPGYENYVYEPQDKFVMIGNDYHQKCIIVPVEFLTELDETIKIV